MQEARTLIKHWLINLIACFNDVVLARKKRATLETLDTFFDKAEPLRFFPRFVFGMLKNRLLSLNHVHPDSRIFTHCLYRCACACHC